MLMSSKGNDKIGGTTHGKSGHGKGGHVWRQPDGNPVSCVEKIKVLNQNLDEIRQLAQDALEDAILMGCDEAQVRAILQALVEDLQNPYRKEK
jgi:hypothetical protein